MQQYMVHNLSHDVRGLYISMELAPPAWKVVTARREQTLERDSGDLASERKM